MMSNDDTRPPNWSPYHYNAVVDRWSSFRNPVYDADTITLIVDLGFKTFREMTFRLYGINAWEVRGEERPKGLVARDWLREQIPKGTNVEIVSHKDKKGKYGRYLCVIWVRKDSFCMNINSELVVQGHAIEKEY